MILLQKCFHFNTYDKNKKNYEICFCLGLLVDFLISISKTCFDFTFLKQF